MHKQFRMGGRMGEKDMSIKMGINEMKSHFTRMNDTKNNSLMFKKQCTRSVMYAFENYMKYR